MVNIIIKPNYTSTFFIDCDINSTIQIIKDKIKEKLFIDESKYYLIYLREIITDNNLTLINLGIKNGDIFNLYYNLQNEDKKDSSITNSDFKAKSLNLNEMSQIDEDIFSSIMEDWKYSLDYKFELIKYGIKNMTKMSKETSGILYSYLHLFSSDQIDQMYQLEPNNYWFFRYLPSVELIDKYWSKDSNKFHGITKNVVISDIERSQLIKKYLK